MNYKLRIIRKQHLQFSIFNFQLTLFIVHCSLFIACGDNYVPRPYGYFRVDLPENQYHSLGDTLRLPYTFDISDYAAISESKEKNKANKFWIDINYPALNAYIYCSYRKINNDLFEISEETREMVYKQHSSRADGILETSYQNPKNKVFGLLYNLEGNTASTLQFVLTDSVRHFFRGAVYFNNMPNKDSIAPMAEFVREDVVRLMESFQWR